MAYFFKRLGYVYFAKHSHRDMVKIGFCRNPRVRVRELGFRGKWGKFRLIGAIRGRGTLEKKMHQQFDYARLKIPDGIEFFRYSMISDVVLAIVKKRRKAA